MHFATAWPKGVAVSALPPANAQIEFPELNPASADHVHFNSGAMGWPYVIPEAVRATASSDRWIEENLHAIFWGNGASL